MDKKLLIKNILNEINSEPLWNQTELTVIVIITSLVGKYAPTKYCTWMILCMVIATITRMIIEGTITTKNQQKLEDV